MRFQGFMGIRSLAKQIQSSFDKSLHCHEMLVRMQIPRVLCLRHAVVFFLSSKNAFRSKCYHRSNISWQQLKIQFGPYSQVR